jgi:hypothetical protein
MVPVAGHMAAPAKRITTRAAAGTPIFNAVGPERRFNAARTAAYTNTTPRHATIANVTASVRMFRSVTDMGVFGQL